MELAPSKVTRSIIKRVLPHSMSPPFFFLLANQSPLSSRTEPRNKGNGLLSIYPLAAAFYSVGSLLQ